MKTFSQAVQDALYTVNAQDLVHLLTIDFASAWGGTRRWNSSAASVVYSGTTWVRGPVIVGNPKVDNRSGAEVGTLQFSLASGSLELITGKNLKIAATEGAFDRVHVLYQRGVYVSDACVGLITEFEGYVSKVVPGSVTLDVTAKCVRSKLTEPLPRRSVQASCPYRLYDANTCKGVAGSGGTCDHTIATCRNTFNNVARFGGFPFVPSEEAR